MSLDAMKQALEALESNPDAMVDCGDGHWDFKRDLAITALRAAIEQAHDWDEVEALQASLREHMAEIHRLRAAIEQAQEPVAWILEWIEDGEVYASKLYESERRCRYDAKKDTNAVCRPLVYGDKLKEKNNG